MGAPGRGHSPCPCLARWSDAAAAWETTPARVPSPWAGGCAGGGGREHTRSAASAARPHLDGTVGHGPSTHSGPPPPLAQRQRIFGAGEWGEELPLTVRLRACELNRVRVKVHGGLFLRMCPLMFF